MCESDLLENWGDCGKEGARLQTAVDDSSVMDVLDSLEDGAYEIGGVATEGYNRDQSR